MKTEKITARKSLVFDCSHNIEKEESGHSAIRQSLKNSIISERALGVSLSAINQQRSNQFDLDQVLFSIRLTEHGN